MVGCSALLALPVWGVCPPGDLTGDCRVTLADVLVLSRAWLTGDGIPGDMVTIPSGVLVMGDYHNEGNADEFPIHVVTLDSFAIDKYLITNGEYCAFLNAAQPIASGNNNGVIYGRSDTSLTHPYFSTSIADSLSQIDLLKGYGNPPPPDRYSVRLKGRSNMSKDPIVCVTWYGAVAYCNWRSQQEGFEPCYDLSTWTCDFTKNGYRLPTEAEWEYAARGGLVGNRFPWGETITQNQANYYSYWFQGIPSYPYDLNPTPGYHPIWSQDGIHPFTSPVGSFPANGYGLYDMAGNVWEWCNDWYSATYYSSGPPPSKPFPNPKGPATGTSRVIRGGGWDYFSAAYFCRVSARNYGYPDLLHSGEGEGGFRVVLGLK